MARLERTISRIAESLNAVASATLTGMMFLTFTDVGLRYVFNRPLTGCYEITEFMMAILISFSLAHTQVLKGHVFIDVFVYRLPQRVQAVVDSIVYFLSMGTIFIISWQALLRAQEMKKSGEVSGVMPVPIYLFLYVFALGTLLLFLVIVVDFLKSLVRAGEK
jgi:TRAP-type C4-dicarboxylate transport system permease small subunit